MKNVYDECPEFESENFIFRFPKNEDCEGLQKIYGDKNALPFFNSDNCHGDNFYYPTVEKMKKAMDFWFESYKSKWFVRWSVIEKKSNKIIGSVEMFNRTGNDDFNGVGLLRIDLATAYENCAVIKEILSALVPSFFGLFDCSRIITKGHLFAVDRLEALESYGFRKSESFLVGTMDNYSYKDYWEIGKL